MFDKNLNSNKYYLYTWIRGAMITLGIAYFAKLSLFYSAFCLVMVTGGLFFVDYIANELIEEIDKISEHRRINKNNKKL